MMKTLILCIDRDNDFGEKAGVKSPMIGRVDNLNAALSLILKDPEDSDANAVFSGISTYDNLLKAGEDVEIATICGNKEVGETSDNILMKQLDYVISKVKPDDVVIVTDGAEDEFVIPLVMSRVKIRTVKRVIVRQEKNIESLYYIVVKALKEEKFLKRVLAPIGVALLVLGISMLIVMAIRIDLFGWGTLDPATSGFIAVVTAIGMYFLGKAYSIGKKMSAGLDRITEEFLYTRITVFSFLIAASVFSYGVYLGYIAALQAANVGLSIILLLYRIIPFTIVAIIIYDLGRIIESFTLYEKGRRRQILITYLMSAGYSVSFAVAVLGLISFVTAGFQAINLRFVYDRIAFALTVIGMVSGIIISIERKRYETKHREILQENRVAQKDSGKTEL
jgi:putative membrane protein